VRIPAALLCSALSACSGDDPIGEALRHCERETGKSVAAAPDAQRAARREQAIRACMLALGWTPTPDGRNWWRVPLKSTNNPE
jgi:hypothetical protein